MIAGVTPKMIESLPLDVLPEQEEQQDNDRIIDSQQLDEPTFIEKEEFFIAEHL